MNEAFYFKGTDLIRRIKIQPLNPANYLTGFFHANIGNILNMILHEDFPLEDPPEDPSLGIYSEFRARVSRSASGNYRDEFRHMTVDHPLEFEYQDRLKCTQVQSVVLSRMFPLRTGF